MLGSPEVASAITVDQEHKLKTPYELTVSKSVEFGWLEEAPYFQMDECRQREAAIEQVKSLEVLPQQTRDRGGGKGAFIKLYHYTTHASKDQIVSSKVIKISKGKNGDAVLGKCVYLTTLGPDTPDEVLAKNNWTTSRAGDQLDVVFEIKMPKDVIGRKLFDGSQKLGRNVWTFNEPIFLNICTHRILTRHADGRWQPQPENAAVVAGVAAGAAAYTVAAGATYTVSAGGIAGFFGATQTVAYGAALGGPVGATVAVLAAAVAYNAYQPHRAPFHNEEF